jgi:MFS family permease
MPTLPRYQRRSPQKSTPVSVYFVYALALFNGIGVFSSQMVLSLYALNLGASPLAVGLLAATYSLFPMLLAVSAGKLIDRFGARWPMTAGATCGGIGMLVPYFVQGLPAVYVAGATNGLRSGDAEPGRAVEHARHPCARLQQLHAGELAVPVSGAAHRRIFDRP